MRRLVHFGLPGLLVLSVIVFVGCGGGSDSGGGDNGDGGGVEQMDYSGTYDVTVLGDLAFTGTAVVTQSGNNVSGTLTLTDVPQIPFTGTVSGNTMTLAGSGVTVTLVLQFSADGQSFTGTWDGELDGQPGSGTISGTKTS